VKSSDIRAILLEAIDLFLLNTPQAVEQARLKIEVGRRSISSDTVNFVILHRFFSELTDSEYFESREFLLERKHDLLGLSNLFFHAYVGNDYIQSASNAERQMFTFLRDAVNWLRSLEDAHEEDDQRYQKIQQTLNLYRSGFSHENDIGDQKIVRLIMGMTSSIVENIEVPTLSFARYHHLIAMPFSAVGIRNEEEYPSVSPDLAWALNGLTAMQGQAWLSFHWQFYPTTITLFVK